MTELVSRVNCRLRFVQACTARRTGQMPTEPVERTTVVRLASTADDRAARDRDPGGRGRAVPRQRARSSRHQHGPSTVHHHSPGGRSKRETSSVDGSRPGRRPRSVLCRPVPARIGAANRAPPAHPVPPRRRSGSASGDASAAGGPSDPNGQIIFGAAGAPEHVRPAVRHRRRDVPGGPADDRGPGRLQAGHGRCRAGAGPVLGAVRGRADLDLQAAGRREIPRRNPAGRRGRLLQPRPDVHPDRRRRDPGPVLVGHHGRLQGSEERHRRTGTQRLRLLRGARTPVPPSSR